MSFYTRAVLYLHGGRREYHYAKKTFPQINKRLLFAQKVARKLGMMPKIISLNWEIHQTNFEILRKVDAYFKLLEEKELIKIKNGKLAYKQESLKGGIEEILLDIFSKAVSSVYEDIEMRTGKVPKILSFLSKRTQVLKEKYEKDKYFLKEPLKDFIIEETKNGHDHKERSFLNLSRKLVSHIQHPLLNHLTKELGVNYRIMEISKTDHSCPPEITEKIEEARAEKLGSIYDHFAQIPREGEAKKEEEMADKLTIVSFDSFLGEDKNYLAIMGDIHFGPWRHKYIRELNRCLYMINLFKGVPIFNGDIFDLLLFGSKIEKIREENYTFWRAMIKFPKIFYILGNHEKPLFIKEEELEVLPKNLDTTLSLYDNKRRIYIAHGYQPDKHNKEGAKTGWLITKSISLVSRIFGFSMGGKFTGWLELFIKFYYLLKEKILRKDAWYEYKIKSIVEWIKEIFDTLQEEYHSSEPFSEKKPLIFIMGHEHFHGVGYLRIKIEEEINKNKKLKGKVKFFFSGSWQGEKGYPGDFIILDLKNHYSTEIYRVIWKSSLVPLEIEKEKV